MLFYGPPGTGKTSTILALARDLFGPQLYKSRILELNASDERGIDVVREKVKNFAKTTARETVPGYPCPPFKLIILDEADSLTGDAQTALRRVMELYSKSTRFCLVCNYVSRIIEPLTSRCAKFRYKPVQASAGVERLAQICEAEGVQFAAGVGQHTVLDRLIGIAEGDLRRAITLLQMAHRLGGPLTTAMLEELGGVIPESLIQESLSICTSNGPIQGLVEFCEKSIILKAYPVQQFLHQFSLALQKDLSIAAGKKAMIALKIGKVDSALQTGADEHLQLLDLLAYAQTLLSPPCCPSQVSAWCTLRVN